MLLNIIQKIHINKTPWNCCKIKSGNKKKALIVLAFQYLIRWFKSKFFSNSELNLSIDFGYLHMYRFDGKT
jgi:hypothetical protein